MKAQDLEGKVLEQAVQGGQQVGLADALAGGHQFELREAVHGVDVIDALEAVLVTLVNAVDADEAGAPFGGGRAPLTDGDRVAVGLGPVHAFGLVARQAAQVVQMRHRDVGQALVTGICIQAPGALHQATGGRPRQGAV